MKLSRLNTADLVGVLSIVTAAQAKAGLEILALFIAIAATAPLAVMRWRMILRGQPVQDKDLGKDESHR